MKAPSEKHLEDWIVNNSLRFGSPETACEQFPVDPCDYFWLSEETFILPYVRQLIGRQVRVAHGIIDLLSRGDDSIEVIELKKDAITLESVAQCARYIHDVKSVTRHVFASEKPDWIDTGIWFGLWDERMQSPMVSGGVVGRSLPDKNTMALAALCNIDLVVYDYAPDDEYRFEITMPRIDHATDISLKVSSEADQKGIFSAVAQILNERLSWFKRGVE